MGFQHIDGSWPLDVDKGKIQDWYSALLYDGGEMAMEAVERVADELWDSMTDKEHLICLRILSDKLSRSK